jgi:hypothetical protein
MRPSLRDTWLLRAALGFLPGMMMAAIVLFLSPLLFLFVLVFGAHFMSRDEIGLMKVLLVIVGPFAFVFWWIAISHISGRYRTKRLVAEGRQTGYDYSDAELTFLQRVDKPKHLRNFVVLLASLVGSIGCAFLCYNMGDRMFFLGVLVGIFSPAIGIAAYAFLTIDSLKSGPPKRSVTLSRFDMVFESSRYRHSRYLQRRYQYAAFPSSPPWRCR